MISCVVNLNAITVTSIKATTVTAIMAALADVNVNVDVDVDVDVDADADAVDIPTLGHAFGPKRKRSPDSKNISRVCARK